MTNPSPPHRPSPDQFVRSQQRALSQLAQGDVSLWHYVVRYTPGSPPPAGVSIWDVPTADVPGDAAVFQGTAASPYGCGDPAAPFFLNGWTNKPLPDTGLYSPVAFRIHPATKTRIVGHIGGGTYGTTAFVLPSWACPRFEHLGVITSGDGKSAISVKILTTGEVIPLAQIATTGSGGGGGGVGIVFDFNNVGDYLDVTVTGADSLGTGVLFRSTGAGDIDLIAHGGGQIFLSQENDGGINLQDVGAGGINLDQFGGGGISLNDSGSGGIYAIGNGGITLHDTSSSGVLIREDGNGGIDLTSNGTGGIAITDASMSGGNGISLLSGGTGGGITLRSISGLEIEDHSTFGLSIATISSSGPLTIEADSSGGIAITDNGGGGISVTDNFGGGIFLNGLPIVNPGGSGQVWNNGGVLNIT